MSQYTPARASPDPTSSLSTAPPAHEAANLAKPSHSALPLSRRSLKVKALLRKKFEVIAANVARAWAPQKGISAEAVNSASAAR